jgi:hypothetical protein
MQIVPIHTVWLTQPPSMSANPACCIRRSRVKREIRATMVPAA